MPGHDCVDCKYQHDWVCRAPHRKTVRVVLREIARYGFWILVALTAICVVTLWIWRDIVLINYFTK